MNVGDKIPEILGIDQDGREIKTSDYRGRKLVLYSYPKANTSGCTAEACSLQAHKEELAAAGYEIIGVSKDKQALQKKFAETKGLQFPLIADTETTLLQELGCWGEKVTCGRKSGLFEECHHQQRSEYQHSRFRIEHQRIGDFDKLVGDDRADSAQGQNRFAGGTI